MRGGALALVLAGGLMADKPAPLENTGKPMRVVFQCTEEDVIPQGLTCSAEEPCPVYLELSGLEIVGNKMFVAGNLHTASTTFYSILLASEDGGKTWSEPHERIRAAGLEQIQFFDFETGWIAGQVLATLPRDPFLLITTDRGKTWRQRPVFSETRVGAVEQFWFESKTQGALLIDRTQTGDSAGRHELYETMTGGESWMVRQVSTQPIPLKRARTPNPDWRLRPDRATRSYAIEKRAGERWQIVASFLVRIGDCKLKERELAEPPPIEPEKPAQPVKPPTLKKKP